MFFSCVSRVGESHTKRRLQKTGVPEFGTVLTGIGAGLLADLFPIDQLASVISIGTLLVSG